MSYLAGWRLALAADLLVPSDATVAAVARQVGFGTRSPSVPPSSECTVWARSSTASAGSARSESPHQPTGCGPWWADRL